MVFNQDISDLSVTGVGELGVTSDQSGSRSTGVERIVVDSEVIEERDAVSSKRDCDELLSISGVFYCERLIRNRSHIVSVNNRGIPVIDFPSEPYTISWWIDLYRTASRAPIAISGVSVVAPFARSDFSISTLNGNATTDSRPNAGETIFDLACW